MKRTSTVLAAAAAALVLADPGPTAISTLGLDPFVLANACPPAARGSVSFITGMHAGGRRCVGKMWLRGGESGHLVRRILHRGDVGDCAHRCLSRGNPYTGSSVCCARTFSPLAWAAPLCPAAPCPCPDHPADGGRRASKCPGAGEQRSAIAAAEAPRGRRPPRSACCAAPPQPRWTQPRGRPHRPSPPAPRRH